MQTRIIFTKYCCVLPLKIIAWFLLIFALPLLAVGLLLDKFDEDIYF